MMENDRNCTTIIRKNGLARPLLCSATGAVASDKKLERPRDTVRNAG
jgi:hypothetical protein